MDERAGEKAFATLGYWFWVTGVSFGVLRIFFHIAWQLCSLAATTIIMSFLVVVIFLDPFGKFLYVLVVPSSNDGAPTWKRTTDQAR